MSKAGLRSTAAALLIGLGAGAAFAQNLPPEPAPEALQNAPPAMIAPPINAGERNPAIKPQTGGVQKLAPGSGENTRVEGDVKSHPAGKASTTGQGAASGSENHNRQ